MKFGIFYEHQIGRPWEDDTDVRLIHDALEQIELADQLRKFADDRAAGRRDPSLGILG
jgi:hypothetical protein